MATYFMLNLLNTVLLGVVILQQYQQERRLIAAATLVGELIDIEQGKAERVQP